MNVPCGLQDIQSLETEIQSKEKEKRGEMTELWTLLSLTELTNCGET